MSELRDPERWLSDAPTDIAESFIGAAREYRERGPDPQQRERMWQELERELPVLEPARGWRSWRTPALGIGAGVLLGAAAAWWFAPEPRPAVPLPPPMAAAAPVPEQLQVPPPLPAAEPTPAASPAPATRARAALRAQPASLNAGRAARPPSAASARDGSSSELELLVRARRLVRSSPAAALELAEQHQSQFPRGTFNEERELLAIEALRGLGRAELSAERARRFRAMFPNSAHRARVDVLSGRE